MSVVRLISSNAAIVDRLHHLIYVRTILLNKRCEVENKKDIYFVQNCR